VGGSLIQLINGANHQGIVESLRAYNLKKNIKEQLKIINPFLGKQETDIKVHLMNALVHGFITKSEFDFLKIKMALGRMYLEMEDYYEE